jgi:hypothetical protein
MGSVSALAVLTVGWPWLLRDRRARPMALILPWVGLYTVLVVATILPLRAVGYQQFPLLNALGAYVLPLALVILMWFWSIFLRPAELALVITRTIVAGMSCNALLSIYELVTRNVAGLSILQHFWSVSGASGDSALSVGVMAAENERYTGIFYQPAIAGVAYGVALFSLIYLLKVRTGRRRGYLVLAGYLLCIGGIVTVSKVFVIGALPIALVLLMLDQPRRLRVLIWLASFALAFRVLAEYGVLPSWSTGGAMLQHLVNPRGSIITTYSAGRYGTGGTLAALTGTVLRVSPWAGFGAGGIVTAYDSMWTETLAVTGLFGVGFLLVEFIVLFARWARARTYLARPEWRLIGATLVLALGGSLGVPTLTGQRISVLLWLIIGLLVVPRPGAGPSHRTSAATRAAAGGEIASMSPPSAGRPLSGSRASRPRPVTPFRSLRTRNIW